MLPFQIKICGITSKKDAFAVCQSQADAIGLNFYSGSSRYVDTATARAIVQDIRGFDAEPMSTIKFVGVFVNMPVAEMVEIASSVGLDAIQIHGDEQPVCLVELRSLIGSRGFELKCGIIRAIRTKPALGSQEDYETNQISESNRIESEIESWVVAGIDSVLLDAAVPGEFGGTGEVVDWGAVAGLKCSVPIVLAGGLRPENVRNAVEVSKVRAVDVASGVEAFPGVKDLPKVKLFAEEAVAAFA